MATKSMDEVVWARHEALLKLMPRHLTKRQIRVMGKRLASRRSSFGLSQRDLAFPGCSYTYISRIEKGEREPSLRNLIMLCFLLRTSPMWVLWGFGDEDTEDHTSVFLVSDPHEPKALAALATKRNSLHQAARRRARLERELHG